MIWVCLCTERSGTHYKVIQNTHLRTHIIQCSLQESTNQNSSANRDLHKPESKERVSKPPDRAFLSSEGGWTLGHIMVSTITCVGFMWPPLEQKGVEPSDSLAQRLTSLGAVTNLILSISDPSERTILYMATNGIHSIEDRARAQPTPMAQSGYV